MNEELNQFDFETRAIRGQLKRTEYREHSSPLFLTSSFCFDSIEQAKSLFADEIEGNIYSRFSNPNTDEFISKLSNLEGTESGLATASGMSAIFVSLAGLVSAGDNIIACRSIFGSTHQILTQILPRFGVSFTYVDIEDQKNWKNYFQKNTKLFFLETPSNPTLDIIDIQAISEICKENNVLLNVDNCFATPYLQRPIEFGADIITHSATKFMDGQGRVLGGAILSNKEITEKLRFFARHTGPSLSPFNAWILSKSLETLSIRMERHSESAFKLAESLEKHPKIKKVKYPFLKSNPSFDLAKKQMKLGGGLLSIYLDSFEKGKKFIELNTLFSHTANLGDSRTIITHPASTTHSKLSVEERAKVGIEDGLVRISVGLESFRDIIYEIDKNLNLL
jgi:O-succinylhomoserine sulfhydrylase